MGETSQPEKLTNLIALFSFMNLLSGVYTGMRAIITGNCNFENRKYFKEMALLNEITVLVYHRHLSK